MGVCVDPALHARVVVEGIAVKVTEFRGVPFQNRALKRCDNVGFNKSRFLEGYQSLETLDEEHYVLVINVFAHRHYLVFSMCFIEMRFELAEIRLILSFGGLYWQVHRRGEFARRVRIGRGSGGAGFPKEQGLFDHLA